MKELIKKAMDFGSSGYLKGLLVAPGLNVEFISFVCETVGRTFGDDKECNKRAKLYKAYTKGFILEMLKD